MLINELYACRGVVIRVLGLMDNRALVINCLEKKVPYWLNMETADNWETISQEQLLSETKTIFPSFDEIPEDKRKLIQERYGTISLILPYITDDIERNSAIDICAKKFKLSKATIRARLCAYLIHQDIRVFLPTINSDKYSTDALWSENWALYKAKKYWYSETNLNLGESYWHFGQDGVTPEIWGAN